MSYASIAGWRRLPMKTIRELHPMACDTDPFVAFQIEPLRVEIRGDISASRQLQSIGEQLQYIERWLYFRHQPDFELCDG